MESVVAGTMPRGPRDLGPRDLGLVPATGGIVRVAILRVSDLKVAIAYSSVVHISIVITRILAPITSGLVGGVWMILAHGLTSSGMFGGGNLLYTRTHTRRLISNKGILATMPAITSL